MIINQLSIFVENRPGRMAEITQTLAQNNIDIRALSLADTSDFGILRLIVSNPGNAIAVLREKGVMVRQTEVIAVGVSDKPGEFARAVQVLSEAGVNIEYLYAFLSRKDGEAVVILRTDDLETAIGALGTHGVRLLGANEVYNL